MKNIFLIALFLFLNSCLSPKFKVIKYAPYKGGAKYSVTIPNGFTENRTSGGNEYHQEYRYQDSIVFYITSFENTDNYEEIRAQGSYYDRFNAITTKDTLTLKGIDSEDLHWKDKLLKSGITVGYSNVPKERLKEFETALNSIKERN